MALENSPETILGLIVLVAAVSVGVTIFVLRYFQFSKKVIPEEKQTLIQEYQQRVQGLQISIQESQETIQEHQTTIQRLQAQLKIKDKRSWQAGQNSAKGGVAEFLGYLGLSLTQKFDLLCMLTSTSKKPSVDAIGFNEENVTFLEFKKAGANLTTKENKVKKLISEGKVEYKIIDVNLPENLTQVRKIKEKEVNLCHIQN